MRGVRLAPLPPSVVCPSHPSCGWGCWGLRLLGKIWKPSDNYKFWYGKSKVNDICLYSWACVFNALSLEIGLHGLPWLGSCT